MSSQLPLSLSPLSLPQDDRATQDHSTEGQPCQAQSSGLHSFGFPLRVIPPGCEKHPGPRPPIEAYLEAQRWIKWQPDSYMAGIWDYEWLKHPTLDDVSLLVEEMALLGILPECFSARGGDQEAAAALIEPFNSGDNNKLYLLRCRCRPTSREEQVVVAGTSPRDLSQSSSDIESPRPLTSSSLLTPSGCRSTLLHHDGGCDKQDSCDGSHIPGEVLLRLSLPLDPYFHTESEVATAHFTRGRGIPVPRIYAYDSSAVNCLGIEWQLVEKIPGRDANFVSKIMTEESNVLWARGSPPLGISTGQSAAWTRLGHQLEETLALLRSEGHRSHRGQSSGACFDKIGSLYWDFEKHDFVLGPVSNHYFIRGRRILYHQRHDGGDRRFPLLRGPFGSVSEFLNAMLTIWLRESNDEALRVDDDQPNLPASPASSEANDNTATTSATPDSVTDADDSSECEEWPQTWYTKAHVEVVHDQVSKLRDIIIPWLAAKLTPEQQERMRTYISHPDLSCSNLLVSRGAQTRMDGDGDGDRINILGEEHEIRAILDWEHTVALPDVSSSQVLLSSGEGYHVPHCMLPHNLVPRPFRSNELAISSHHRDFSC